VRAQSSLVHQGKLTKARVYRAIVDLRENGEPPTQRDVAELCGISRTTVAKYLDEFVAEGLLFPYKGKQRALVLTDRIGEPDNNDFRHLIENGRMPWPKPDEVVDWQRTLGRTIRRLRDERRLPQKTLAFQANMAVSYLSGVEGGRRNISLANICQLAAALQVRPSELLADINMPHLPGADGR
jgi:transcriptional regulator with XRE-family HTH domain